jgi:hypothetical protein
MPVTQEQGYISNIPDCSPVLVLLSHKEVEEGEVTTDKLIFPSGECTVRVRIVLGPSSQTRRQKVLLRPLMALFGF